MINLGIDFGSTYTMVSVYKDDKPVTIPENNNSFNYPSVVAYDARNNRYYYGSGARNRIGKPNIRIYRGFKMLLNQQMAEEELASRGYDDVNTPEHITSLFLRYVIDSTLNKIHEEKVNMLVLGAPECWFQSIRTVDARGVLRNICSEMKDLVEKVKIISEPTCAATLCVWNYERRRNESFEGHILVVDYGGGTLDTAVVSVSHYRNKLRIKPEARFGAGENENGEIGKAGIAYQENVLKRAIRTALQIPAGQIRYTESFVQALRDFENTLISDANIIDEVFEESLLDPAGLEEEMMNVTYEDSEIVITYKMLKESYEEVIRPVLKKVLDKTLKDVKDVNDVHVALVGGFCNFYLVRKQVEEYFRLGQIGSRIRNLLHPEDEREKAISNGAALFAEGITDLCYVAEFGIGMYAVYEDGSVCKNYAISCGQEYVPGKVYFACDTNGVPSPMVLVHKDRFILNFTRNPDHYLPMRPVNIFSERLDKTNAGYFVFVGFAIDENERISVSIFPYENSPKYRGPAREPADVIDLLTIKDSFENTVPKWGITEGEEK